LSVCRHRGRRKESAVQQGNLPVVSHCCISAMLVRYTDDAGGWVVRDPYIIEDVGAADAEGEIAEVVAAMG
jgi:hypothetical protein